MPIQVERDPKSTLRFFITVLEGEVGPVHPNLSQLDISAAEALLATVKKAMEFKAQQLILSSQDIKALLPSGPHGAVDGYSAKRPKAGTTPAHYRVGIRVTFNDPVHAKAFAEKLKI